METVLEISYWNPAGNVFRTLQEFISEDCAKIFAKVFRLGNKITSSRNKNHFIISIIFQSFFIII